jgi:thiol-disulfide isomerase/thioredoxin
MGAGVWVVLVVLVAASAFGLWRARTDGRVTSSRHESDPGEGTSVRALVGGAVREDAFGERATLLQFSSAFCAPCRATRRVLADVAEVVPGVTHVEVDAEHHLEAVRRLDVHRTPTTIVLDARGREVSRAVGAPRKEQVLAALADVVG